MLRWHQTPQRTAIHMPIAEDVTEKAVGMPLAIEHKFEGISDVIDGMRARRRSVILGRAL
jgi:hypothetical protein